MKIYKIKSDSNHLFKLKIYIKNLVFVKVRLFRFLGRKKRKIRAV